MPHSPRLTLALCALLGGASIASGAAGQTIRESAAPAPDVVAQSNGLIAHTSGGELLWRIVMPDEGPRHLRQRADGRIEFGRRLISADGQVLAHVQARTGSGQDDGSGGIAGAAASCAAWDDPLAEMTPAPGISHSDTHSRPLVDSQGNVWTIITHIAGPYALHVRRSEGHDNAWQPVQVVSDTTTYVSQPEGAIDPDDNITIIFRDISAGYHLYAVRYEPGLGWSDLTPVHSTGTFFSAIEIGADADGDVAAVFDPEGRAWSSIYDAQSGQWSAAAALSPEGAQILLPTVSQNRAGTAMYLTYLVTSGAPLGLYAHRFDSDTNSWGPAVFLPGSENAGFQSATSSSRHPLVIGGDDEATVFWQSMSSPYSIHASRTLGGVWQAASELIPPSPHSADMENFTGAYANDAGDVMAVLTRFEGALNRFHAFRYDKAADTWTVENPYTSTVPIGTRVRVSLYGGAKAIATFLGSQSGLNQLTSLRYTGAAWREELIDIPGPYASFYQDHAAGGDASCLIFKALDEGDIIGLRSSWWRDTIGDLDCDGIVGAADLAILLGNWGVCPDCDADLNGDSVVAPADLAIVLGNWG